MQITDHFTGTNGTAISGRTPDTAGTATWSATSAWTIQSNQAQKSGSSPATAVIDCGASDCDIQVTLNSTGQNPGVLFRYADANNYWFVYTISNYIHICKRQGGTLSDPAFSGWVNNGQTTTTGGVWKVSLRGSIITVYYNGTQVLQKTDTSGFNTTATNHGLYADASGTVLFDDFSVVPVATMATDRSKVLAGSGTFLMGVTGSGTSWATSSPLFAFTSAPTGWSVSGQTVNSDTSATLTVTRGSGTGAFVLTDGTLTTPLTATNTATAAATGNWSAVSTWDVKLAPGSGNLATVPTGLTVTVDSNASVGTSPSDQTTNVLTCTGTGSLTVADGVTLTVKGNASIDNGTLQVGTGATGGAVLEFDSSAVAFTNISAPAVTATQLGTGSMGAWGATGTYYYKVTALTAAGETTPGSEGSAAVTSTANGVYLSWPAVNQATGYKIYRSTVSGGQTSSPALLTTVTSGFTTAYLDTGTATVAGAAPASNTAGAGLQYQCVVGGNNKTASQIKTRGTAANPAVVRSNAGGGYAQLSITDGGLDLQYGSFFRLGSTATDAITAGLSSASSGSYAFANCVFAPLCGRVRFGNTLPAGFALTVDNTSFKSFGQNLVMAGATAPSGGVARRVKGAVFYGTPTLCVNGMSVGGPNVADAVLFLGGFPQEASFVGRTTLFQNVFLRHVGGPSNGYGPASGWRMGDWDEVAIACDGSDYDGNGRYAVKRSVRNAHWTTPNNGPAGTYAVTNSLCESFGMDEDSRASDNSDGDFDYGPDATHNSSFYKFLMVPQDRDSSNVPSSPACTATNMAGTGSTYDHCTCYNGQQGFIALNESTTPGTAGQVTSLKSNLVWNDSTNLDTGAFNLVAYIDNPTYNSSPGSFTNDIVASGAADYNCLFNLNRTVTTAGAPGYKYNRGSGSTVPGAHDFVQVDPLFTDKTVRFWRWVKSLIGSNVIPAPASGGSTLTVSDDSKMGGQTAGNASPPATGWRDYCAWGLYKLSLKNEPTHADYDSRYTLAAYKAYVRAGFVPRNQALKNAGHDGVTIGAFDAAPVHYLTTLGCGG